MFQDVFGGTRDVYGAMRLRESLSGSLSVSSMRHLLGFGRLGSFWGGHGGVRPEFEFFGWRMCVCVLSCVGCVRRFVVCVGVLVGDDGSYVGKLWLTTQFPN